MAAFDNSAQFQRTIADIADNPGINCYKIKITGAINLAAQAAATSIHVISDEKSFAITIDTTKSEFMDFLVEWTRRQNMTTKSKSSEITFEEDVNPILPAMMNDFTPEIALKDTILSRCTYRLNRAAQNRNHARSPVCDKPTENGQAFCPTCVEIMKKKYEWIALKKSKVILSK